MSSFNIADLVGRGVPTAKQAEFVSVPLDELHEHPANKIFPISEEEVKTLADSIELNGLQQPPLVTPCETGGYTLISGHRRVEAIRLLNWTTVTCKVQNYASPELAELALLTANTETRKDKTWMVPAARRYEEICIQLAAKEQVKLPKLSLAKLAEAIGVKKSELARQDYIARRLDPDVAAKWKNLPTDTAYSIAQMDENCQKALLKNWIGEPPTASAMQELRIAWGIEGINWFAEYFRRKCEAEQRIREAEAKVKAKKEKAKKKADPGEHCYVTGSPVSDKTCPKLTGCGCCHTCSQALTCDNVCIFKRDTIDRHLLKPYAKRIKAVRIAAGETDLCDWENYNKMRWAQDVVGALTDVAENYGCTVDYLMGRSEQMFPTPPVPPTSGWMPMDKEPESGRDFLVIAYFDSYGWDSLGLFNWRGKSTLRSIEELTRGAKMILWQYLPDDLND